MKKLVYGSMFLLGACAGRVADRQPASTGGHPGRAQRATTFPEPTTSKDPVFHNPAYDGRSFLKEFDAKWSDRVFREPDVWLGEDLKVTRIKPTVKAWIAFQTKYELVTFFTWADQNPTALFKELRESDRPILELPDEIPGMKSQFPEEYQKEIKKSMKEGKNAAPMIVVTHSEDIRKVLGTPSVFSVRLYTHKMDTSVGPFMLGHDNKAVNKEKAWMRAIMKREDLPRVREMVKELTKKALEEGNVNGRTEIVNAVARRVPIELTGKYFGFPGPNHRAMYRWSRATQHSYFNNLPNKEMYEAKAIEAGRQMKVYMNRYLAKKRAEIESGKSNEDTILARLIKMKVGDEELMNMPDPTDERKVANILGTLIGGVETTQQAVVNVVDFFLDYPELREQALAAAAAGNDKLFEQFVWEALRFRPVNAFVFRFAEQDFVLGQGTSREYKVRKGQVLIVANESAMFDPAKVKDPYKFSVNRQDVNAPESEYLHFGYGHHKCLGDYVAQVEVPEIVKQILQLPNVRRVEGVMGTIARHDNVAALELVEDKMDAKESSPFPESFVVEYDRPTPLGQVTIADPRFVFEDYLTGYDREEYRNCLSGIGETEETKKMVKVLLANRKQRKLSVDSADLFMCRLPKAFRDCVTEKVTDEQKQKVKRAENLVPDGRYAKTARVYFQACRKPHLSEIETYFFPHETGVVEYGSEDTKQNIDVDESGWLAPLDFEKLKSFAVGDQNSEFERDLKFYDRADFRQAFMNPAGSVTFANDNRKKDMQLIFYSRLDLRWRICNFKLQKLGDGTGTKYYRQDAFKKCQENEKYRLDPLTAKYYKEIMLGR